MRRVCPRLVPMHKLSRAQSVQIPAKEAKVFKGLGTQRLLALFVGGWLLFSFPLLGLWDRDATVLGIPLFPAALFSLWGLLIAAIAWLMERPGQPQDD